MVAEDRELTRHARHDCLAAARKAGEKVWLDEAGQDFDVGLQIFAVYPQIVPEGGAPDALLRALVDRVILDDAVALDQICAQHLCQFAACVGAVRAKRVAKQNVLRRDMGQLLQHCWQQDVVGRGARDVAEDDGDAVLRPGKFAQGTRLQRRAQGVAQRSDRVCQRSYEAVLDYFNAGIVRQLEGQS